MSITKNLQRQQEMFSLVEQWKQSQQSKVTFCKNNSINLHTFEYWHQKYKKQNLSTDFIEIKPNKNHQFPQMLRLQYPNGVSIELPANTNVSVIRALINLQ